jgi:hypothetical protein
MYLGSTVLRRSTSKAAVRLSISIVGKGSGPGVRCLLGWFAALYEYVAVR